MEPARVLLSGFAGRVVLGYGSSMTRSTPWISALPLTTPRLHLEPLRVEHATEAVETFGDARLHTWIGGAPKTLTELEVQYGRQVEGRSPDGAQGWLNWMSRRTSDGRLVGTLQATLERPTDDHIEASLAWVVGVEYQGRGYGREGALTMARWLREQEVDELTAYIHPGHEASIGIARALGLSATSVLVDGEVRWTDANTPPGTPFGAGAA